MKKKDSGKKKHGKIMRMEVLKGNLRNDHGLEEAGDANRPDADQSLSQSPEATAPDQPTTSRMHDYWIRTMLIFADAAVAKDPDEVFDVLARNFDSAGNLSWWLHRVGHGDKAQYAKGRDLVEYIRKVAHELHRDLKEIGKPVARW